MVLYVVLRAADRKAPIGPFATGGPDLLSVEDPLIAFEACAGLHVGEIAAGVGLGVALTPDFLARDDAGEELLFLFFGAEGVQCRAEQCLADMVDATRPAGTGVFFELDNLLGEAQPAAAVFDRPADAGPTRATQTTLPLAALGEERMLVAGAAAALHMSEWAGKLGIDPRAELAAELFVFCAEMEIHGLPTIQCREAPYVAASAGGCLGNTRS